MLDLTLFEEVVTNTDSVTEGVKVSEAESVSAENEVSKKPEEAPSPADMFYRRVKEIKARQHSTERELVSLMAQRFGVAKGDYEGIKAAIDDEIAKNGKSDDISEKLKSWQEREAEVQKIYPGFVLANELKNRDFFNLCYNGVDVMTAYQVVHFDDIIMAAMSYAISEMRKADMMRGYSENRRAREGALDDSSCKMRQEKPKLTRKERNELIRRAERGETVRL